MSSSSWRIVVTQPAADWLRQLRSGDRATRLLVAKAFDLLAERGPALGRPLVDTIHGSSLANLKELRPGSSGPSEIRILFVFDPKRQAVVLVAGDKAGNWGSWYDTAIKQAEVSYAAYLEEQHERDGQ